MFGGRKLKSFGPRIFLNKIKESYKAAEELYKGFAKARLNFYLVQYDARRYYGQMRLRGGETERH